MLLVGGGEEGQAKDVKVDEGVVVVATPRTRSLLRQCQYLLPVAVVAHSNACACSCLCEVTL